MSAIWRGMMLRWRDFSYYVTPGLTRGPASFGQLSSLTKAGPRLKAGVT